MPMAFFAFLAMFLFQGNVTTSPVAGGGMSGQAIVTVSAAVVALTQLLKFANVINDKRGPLGVLFLALLGVVFWAWTTGDFSRATAFAYFAGWIAVATSAAGVFGFTRAMPEAVTATKTPPPGAGASPTVD
jgi:hypothetical protein